METLKPLMQRNVASLHGRVHGYGEIASALRFGTPIGAFRLDWIGVVDNATARANGAVWPAQVFKILAGCGIISEMSFGECVHAFGPS